MLPRASKTTPRCPKTFLRSDFGGFLEAKWKLFDTKIKSKIDTNSETEKQLNASQLSFNLISGIDVENQNHLKIDQKTDSKMKCILSSIFLGFWWIRAAKLEP